MSEARRLSSVVDESERQDVSTIAAPQASVPVYEDEEERYLTPRKKAIECLLLFSLARFFFFAVPHDSNNPAGMSAGKLSAALCTPLFLTFT